MNTEPSKNVRRRSYRQYSYAVKAADPVVAAVLFKAPPQGVGLNTMNNPAADNVDLWPVIDMSKPIQEFEKIAVKP